MKLEELQGDNMEYDRKDMTYNKYTERNWGRVRGPMKNKENHNRNKFWEI